MATTTNFGWETPDDTDLVKDGALAMRTLGNAIDASLVDLKGGTTGQVLSKTSNTDMDFTWVTSDDANAIQNAIVDARGDLITATAADTPARLAVGNNGETLVADSSTSTGLRWQGQYPAGKNVLINGLLDFWQRNTSVTFSGGPLYNAYDRWANFSTNSSTFARESSIVPAGCTYSCKITVGASASPVQSEQAIETLNAAPLAGQTMTFSAYFQSSATPTISFVVYYSTATDVAPGGAWTTISATSGGSGTAGASSFTRISGTYVIPSNAKSVKVLWFSSTMASGSVLYWSGAQFEAGSVATPLARNASTLAGELAACQRYYYRNAGGKEYSHIGFGMAFSTTQVAVEQKLPVTMRVVPTSIEYSNVAVNLPGAGNTAITSLAIVSAESSPDIVQMTAVVASGLTQYRPYYLLNNNNTAGYVGYNAEL